VDSDSTAANIATAALNVQKFWAGTHGASLAYSGIVALEAGIRER
jgi:hypothetical protein